MPEGAFDRPAMIVIPIEWPSSWQEVEAMAPGVRGGGFNWKS
jgi:hypothetical protein